MKNYRKVITSLSVGAAITGAVLASAGSASAGAYSDSLYKGDSLYADQFIQRTIPQGTLDLIMQEDGNLVEYLHPNGGGSPLVCWASNTYLQGDQNRVTYQSDGNFVMYTINGGIVWSSHTAGGGGSTVDMNSLGVLYVGTKPINNGCGF